MIGRLVRRLVHAGVLAVGVILTLDVLRSGLRWAPADGLGRGGSPSSPVKRWALSAAALLVIAAFGGALLVVSGVVPIKASSGHWPITAWFLDFAKQRSVATHSLGLTAPRLDDPLLVLKGATHYDIGCSPCHGAPDLEPPRITSRMTPPPPYLPDAVGQFEPDELFLIVKHGIKFTGMPAWPAQQRDDEVWAMVAFLQVFPTLDGPAYRRLVNGNSAPGDTGVPLADLDPPAPRAVAETCRRCHGVGDLDRAAGAFPILAGQVPAYLEATLRAYAQGDRHSGIMEPIAAGLDAPEMQAIAAYYARLEPPRGSAAGDDAEAISRGERIATRGLPDRRVPPCLECHGPRPARNPHYPRLAGQYAEYIALQLRLFREERRGGTPYHHIMEKVAAQLTDTHIRDVAAYFATLPPAEAPMLPLTGPPAGN